MGGSGLGRHLYHAHPVAGDPVALTSNLRLHLLKEQTDAWFYSYVIRTYFLLVAAYNYVFCVGCNFIFGLFYYHCSSWLCYIEKKNKSEIALIKLLS